MVTFLIFFREALEASMLCSLFVAYLTLIGQGSRFKEVWKGLAARILASVVVGVAVYFTIHAYVGSSLQLQTEGVCYLLACGKLVKKLIQSCITTLTGTLVQDPAASGITRI